jgi:hypothetical protein
VQAEPLDAALAVRSVVAHPQVPDVFEVMESMTFELTPKVSILHMILKN